jgi:ribonuclease P protein component
MRQKEYRTRSVSEGLCRLLRWQRPSLTLRVLFYNPPMQPSPPLRHTFPRTLRMHGKTLFDVVYKTGKRRSAHPLAMHILRREDNRPSRLGISIGTRCGTAVRRNLIKRRLREAFRLMQHEVAPGFDLLIVVKPHQPLEMLQYQSRLGQLVPH